MLESFSPDLSNSSIYTILFLAMFSNGIINIPSSQFVYLTFGYILTVKSISAPIGILVGTVANTLSNYILYIICLQGSDKINKRLMSFIEVNKEKIDRYITLLQKRGTFWLIVAKATPSIKVFVPIISGLAGIGKLRAFCIFFFGSLVWAIGITYLGYYFGQRLDLAQFYGFYFLFYLIVGLVVSVLYNIKKRKK